MALNDFWAALEARHLAALSFQEVRRGVSALSSGYVEGRTRGGVAQALSGRGKRAAFALFYGPLHFAVTRHVVAGVQAGGVLARIVDLGCGTGAAGAAWALATGAGNVLGMDHNDWALGEARWTWSHFDLRGEARGGDATRERLRGAGSGVLAAYLVNELDVAHQRRLLGNLLAAADAGARVLVIEPIARRDRPWWPDWEQAFAGAGGRSDIWRFEADMPERWRLLDKAAGLRHHTLTARSLYLARKPSAPAD